jgi:hypothetical protein
VLKALNSTAQPRLVLNVGQSTSRKKSYLDVLITYMVLGDMLGQLLCSLQQLGDDVCIGIGRVLGF